MRQCLLLLNNWKQRFQNSCNIYNIRPYTILLLRQRSLQTTDQWRCCSTHQLSALKPRSRLKLYLLPISLGVAGLAFIHFNQTLRRKPNPASPQPMTWQLLAFLMIPSRIFSRVWGNLMSTELPSWSRVPLLGLYKVVFRCNMEEAERQNLKEYVSFGDFFTRKLKDNVRVIDETHQLVSPSDGTILHFGSIDDDVIEQVKGVHYSLDAFLGPGLLQKTSDPADSNHPTEQKRLFHAILYLGPGDCHYFHSPAQWTAVIIRHLPGELLTVAPWAAKTMPGLFGLNERVILSGEWAHGYFTFAAVGAYNVGSILLTLDKELKTNQKGRFKFGSFTDTSLNDSTFKKGDHIGVFNMGSSVVLIFEAPDNFEFVVKPGQKIKLGQPLGKII